MQILRTYLKTVRDMYPDKCHVQILHRTYLRAPVVSTVQIKIFYYFQAERDDD